MKQLLLLVVVALLGMCVMGCQIGNLFTRTEAKVDVAIEKSATELWATRDCDKGIVDGLKQLGILGIGTQAIQAKLDLIQPPVDTTSPNYQKCLFYVLHSARDLSMIQDFQAKLFPLISAVGLIK